MKKQIKIPKKEESDIDYEFDIAVAADAARYQVKVPNYIGPQKSSGNYDDSYKEMMDIVRKMKIQELEEEMKRPACRLCGEKTVKLDTLPSGRQKSICQKCFNKILEDVIEEKIIDMIRSGDVFCKTCNSHYKACRCPGRKALDGLKK